MEILCRQRLGSTEQGVVVNKDGKCHFSAGIFFIQEGGGKYLLPGVTAKRFPWEVKLPGGTNKTAMWETPEQTLEREFAEETGLTPEFYRLIHTEIDHGHTKHFFVVMSVKGKFDGPKTVSEPDGDELTVKLWDVGEFYKKVFLNHRTAFLKACAIIARADSKFVRNYPVICSEIIDGI